MLRGRLYDGASGYPHDVAVNVGEGRLLLSQPGGWTDSVDSKLLKRLDGNPGFLRLGRTDLPGWRLILPADAEQQLAGTLDQQERYGRWIDRIGLIPALVAGGVITGLVLLIGFLAPAWIAPHVPMSWERNLGTAIVGDFGTLGCRNAAGQRALESLVERVAPGATKGADGIKVAALDVPQFNAAALPGNYIIVFKSAITESEPDALAGILAHEVAHVRRRHVTEALIRDLGIGALVRLFAGQVGTNAEQLVALSYTRSDEAQADADAMAMLKRARISPKPTADLFKRLAGEHEQNLASSAEFLQSHPLSRKRAERFAATYDVRARYSPPLSDDESDALFNVCWKGPSKR